ncbi:hypothetical protein scyTo_0006974 [Scyliorhinus torazame]|uniref:Uncharacterized protein n=1 Tax=Scyliorhinus torazame TaxID=75743 RepID=A0A401NJI7_SCYTO|nr:hypothetical protein [Scyliorhinus torazame]
MACWQLSPACIQKTKATWHKVCGLLTSDPVARFLHLRDFAQASDDNGILRQMDMKLKDSEKVQRTHDNDEQFEPYYGRQNIRDSVRHFGRRQEMLGHSDDVPDPTTSSPFDQFAGLEFGIFKACCIVKCSIRNLASIYCGH